MSKIFDRFIVWAYPFFDSRINEARRRSMCPDKQKSAKLRLLDLIERENMNPNKTYYYNQSLSGSISIDKDLVNYDGRKSSVVTYRTDKQ